MANYVDKIAQRMGISVEEAQRFLGAAQAYAGNNLSYRKIYHHLGNGRWSAQEIQQIADTQGITLDPLRKAVLGTAHTLGTTTADAEEFIRNVDDHFPERVDAADIWTAVQAVDPAHLTVRTIIAEVEKSVIAHELGITPQEVQEFAEIAGELIGMPVSNQEILETIRAADGPLTIDSLLERLDEKSRVFVALAAEIDETPEDAQQFANFVRQTYPWATDQDILNVVRLLAKPDRKVLVIYDSLETLHIDRTLNMDRGLVTDLPRMIADETGYPLTRGDILALITQPGNEDEPLTAENLLLICEVARDKNMPLLAAAQFVNGARHGLEFPVTDAEFRQAFAAARAPKSKASVVAALQMNLETRRLGIELDDLMAEIDRTLHLDVSREQLLEIIHDLGPGVTPVQIIDHLREEFATILFIAGELAIDPAAVGEVIGRLQRLCGWQVTDEDVAQALRLIPGESKTLDQVQSELKVQRIAEALQLAREDARSLPATIYGAERPPVSYSRILEGLAVLDAKTQDVENVTALIRLADTLDTRFEDVLLLRGHAEKDLAKSVPLILLWQTVCRIDAQDQNVESIIDYLKLEQTIGQSEDDLRLITRTVDFLSHNRHRAPRFWALLDKFHKQGNLSIHDLAYIQQLADWPTISLDSSPLSSKDWLTFHGVQHLSSNEVAHASGLRGRLGRFSSSSKREDRTHGLQSLSQQSWRQICSAERRYQVPSRGRAEIIASEALKTRLSLHSLRFIQEGVSAPGVFLQFQFDNPAAVGVVHIDINGRVEGFHQLANSSWFEALIEAIALSFYRDLVIAVNVDLSPKPRNASRTASVSGRAHSQPSPRSIPSRRQFGRPAKKEYSLEDWYRSQEIARHLVRGHTRFISPGFVARPEKQAQARMAGVSLQKGDTWVIEHERGDPQYHMPIELDGVDLTQHTFFSPPRKAAMELEELLR